MGTSCQNQMSRRAFVPVVALLCAALARGEDEKTEQPGTLLPGFTPEGGGGNYNYVGASRFISGSEVELTGNEENSVGAIWSKEVNHADGWEMQFLVQTTGEADSPGKGLAFWYTANVMSPGILFGSEERYEGFGLLFDSYDDDGKNDNPIIMGWINDGTKVFNHDTDGLGTRFGGCRAKYRNRGNKVGIKVQYQHDSLKVLLDMRNNGVWERCLVKDNIYLSAGSYFGFSAANMAESTGDEVRVHNFKVTDLETKESIRQEEEEMKKKEADEKKTRMASGEIHDLAEQMSGMQKDLHEEFLQKISDMIQRDHVTASHEFRSIRTQLTETIEGNTAPKESIEQIQATVTALAESLKSMRKDLDTLKAVAPTGPGKIDELHDEIKKTRESVENQEVVQQTAKATMKDHIDTVQEAITTGGAGGISWTYVILFQVLFVVALVMYKRSGSSDSKQHIV